jgi:hypothetical protein
VLSHQKITIIGQDALSKPRVAVLSSSVWTMTEKKRRMPPLKSKTMKERNTRKEGRTNIT